MKRKLALLGGPRTLRRCNLQPWPQISRLLEKRILNALRSGRLGYSSDSICRRFEEDFSAYHGVPFAVATNSGTSALFLAYFACGIGEHCGGTTFDEVIVPDWGFFATVSPLLHVGAVPVFCDVDPATGNIDPADMESKISERTRAIVVTHIAGHPCDMPSILGVAERHSLQVIEDCSHAHGSRLDGRLVGTFGDVAAFSLQTRKIVCAGEGGVVVSRDPRLFIRAAAVGNFRRLEGTQYSLPAFLCETGLGLKLRLSPLSAALASHHLAELERLIELRRRLLDRLTCRLSNIAGLEVPVTKPSATRGAFYEYPIRSVAAARGEIQVHLIRRALEAEGLELVESNTRVLSSVPLLQMKLRDAVRGLDKDDRTPGSGTARPVAMSLERSTLTLPTFTNEPVDLVDCYAQGIEKVFSSLDELQDFASSEPGV
jgi:perosamine synthetase